MKNFKPLKTKDMEGKTYRIRKRFEVTMDFTVSAKDEDEAWDVASNASYEDVRGDNGEQFIDISVRDTDEEVVSVRESKADIEDGDDEEE